MMGKHSKSKTNSLPTPRGWYHRIVAKHVNDPLPCTCCRAVDEGLCGVPSFQVDDGAVIFGQDKLNIVADIICGWQNSSPTARL